jgi:alpha-2-macroglobulin
LTAEGGCTTNVSGLLADGLEEIMTLRAAPVISLLLAVLFATATAALAQGSRMVVTTEDADYFGFDLRTEQNVTLRECEAACIGDGQCSAFTYNTRARWCFLKSDYNVLNSFPGAVAGRIVDGAGEPDIGAPAALDFVPVQIIDEARRYRAELMQSANSGGAGLVALRDAANWSLTSGNASAAMATFIAAVSIEPEDAGLWTGLAKAAAETPPSAEADAFALQRATTAAAVNAYLLTRTASERAEALAILADALENRNFSRPALSAYEASLALVGSAEVQARYADLKSRKGFRIVGHSVDADSVTPRICVQFSEELARAADLDQYVTVDGARTAAIERSDKELCIEGLRHGGRYRVVLRQGLPSTVGEVLAEPVALEAYIRDRAPSLRFTGENYVLPGGGRHGVPLVSVNADGAELSLHRIGDRSIVRLLTASQFMRQLGDYEVGQIADEFGEPVWQGTLDIASEPNREVVTSIPVDEALADRKPGIYVLTAVPQGARVEYWEARATQWFLVSDIGLTTFAGTDGLSVFARSLATAKPVSGLDLQLVARNNEILGTAVTDGDGRARFDAGLSRGSAGMAPAAISATSEDGDFVFLDLTRPGFDLSDRGVEGRPSPGPLDVYAWTERGIYRAGETVHASALLRNPSTEAVDDLPLTFIFQRPDGVEDRRIVSAGAELGGHAVDLALADNAMRGTWSLRIHADPQQPALAEKMFLVEDFVPDRIEFDLETDVERIAVGETATLSVAGRYLYGAPAAGLALEGQMVIGRSRSWAGFPGYVFGLQDEEDVEDTRISLTGLPKTGEDGIAAFDVSVESTPSSTQLLEARVSIRMAEAGGRAVERSIRMPIAPETVMIGLKPEFTGEQVAEGGTASFRVIALETSGQRVALPGLQWSLIRIERNYQWYRNGNAWNYEPITTTSLVSEGETDAAADSEPQISVNVGWGRYRLEIESDNPSGPATSVEFDAGWYVEATSTETPDGLEIALDRERYAPGDTARLQISPRFAGEVLITVGAESLVSTFTAAVPAEGATLDIPVTADLGAGAYVTATLFRPGEEVESRMPARAVGVRWLKVDPGARRLAVAIETPERVAPEQPLAIPVAVSGLTAGQEAYVTVAAVDVGILNLTSYEPPDPAAWYFGQRMLGLEMRDLYGRLIDGSQGVAGRLRTGGDGGAMTAEGSPPTEKLVAFFSGIVQLDDEGRAEVSFDIPQFNGTARIMAVAWSRTAVGGGSADVIIRDAVVVSTSQPRFLAPGDSSRVLVEIMNSDGPAGEYAVAVAGSGAIAADAGTAPRSVNLPAGGKAAVTVPIETPVAGEGSVHIALTHASGLTVQKSVRLAVRPGVLPVAERRTVRLAPNGGSLRIDGELLASSIPQGASVTVSISAASAFDIPALLMTLDRYPYGCAEQITSRALPLLYVGELSKTAGLEDDPAAAQRVQESIALMLSYQSSAGSFGLWAPGGGDLWLDSYVTDFLTRARERDTKCPSRR